MTIKATAAQTDYSTLQVAELLGMAVRSVQLMVDRGELEAWKTPGGHRRISRASVERALAERQGGGPAASAVAGAAVSVAGSAAAAAPNAESAGGVLLIEDSKHYQNLTALILREEFPQLEVHIADDGFAGLAMAGRLRPRLLLVDILLPGIDGATLIMSLRTHAQFAGSRLIVMTSLDEEDRAPYKFALEGVPVVHKPRLVVDLPARIREVLADAPLPMP